jgi:hypothetical protein
VAVGAVAGLLGGNAETDCACAVALTPASNPTPKTVDLSKLCMLEILPPVINRIRAIDVSTGFTLMQMPIVHRTNAVRSFRGAGSQPLRVFDALVEEAA